MESTALSVRIPALFKLQLKISCAAQKAGKLFSSSRETEVKAFLRRGRSPGIFNGRWRVRAVHQHVERNGGDGLVGKRLQLHFIHELDPSVGHPDIDVCVLIPEIICDGFCRCGNESYADIALGQNDM